MSTKLCHTGRNEPISHSVEAEPRRTNQLISREGAINTVCQSPIGQPLSTPSTPAESSGISSTTGLQEAEHASTNEAQIQIPQPDPFQPWPPPFNAPIEPFSTLDIPEHKRIYAGFKTAEWTPKHPRTPPGSSSRAPNSIIDIPGRGPRQNLGIYNPAPARVHRFGDDITMYYRTKTRGWESTDEGHRQEAEQMTGKLYWGRAPYMWNSKGKKNAQVVRKEVDVWTDPYWESELRREIEELRERPWCNVGFVHRAHTWGVWKPWFQTLVRGMRMITSKREPKGQQQAPKQVGFDVILEALMAAVGQGQAGPSTAQPPARADAPESSPAPVPKTLPVPISPPVNDAVPRRPGICVVSPKRTARSTNIDIRKTTIGIALPPPRPRSSSTSPQTCTASRTSRSPPPPSPSLLPNMHPDDDGSDSDADSDSASVSSLSPDSDLEFESDSDSGSGSEYGSESGSSSQSYSSSPPPPPPPNTPQDASTATLQPPPAPLALLSLHLRAAHAAAATATPAIHRHRARRSPGLSPSPSLIEHLQRDGSESESTSESESESESGVDSDGPPPPLTPHQDAVRTTSRQDGVRTTTTVRHPTVHFAVPSVRTRHTSTPPRGRSRPPSRFRRSPAPSPCSSVQSSQTSGTSSGDEDELDLGYATEFAFAGGMETGFGVPPAPRNTPQDAVSVVEDRRAGGDVVGALVRLGGGSREETPSPVGRLFCGYEDDSEDKDELEK